MTKNRRRQKDTSFKQLHIPYSQPAPIYRKPRPADQEVANTYAHLYPQFVHTPPPEVNGGLSTLSTSPTSAIAQPQEGGGTTPSSMYPPVDNTYQEGTDGD